VKAEGKFGTADADHSGALDRDEFATTRVVRKVKPKCAPVSGAREPPAEESGEG